MDELLSSLKKDDAPAKVFEKILGPDHATLEAALRSYVDQPLPANKLVPGTQKVDATATMTAGPLSEAHAAAYLGDLLFHTNVLAES